MTLLETIKNPEMRKIFGKSEIKIIEKQLKGIKLTQSEKNRLSRDIRKKLDAVRKLSLNAEEFKLKKGVETDRLIQNIKEIILNDRLKNEIKRIILFGSYVLNEFTYRSDVDIAVEFNTISKKDASLFRIRILGDCPKNMDIQVYNILPEKIKKEINIKGRILYSLNGKNNR